MLNLIKREKSKMNSIRFIFNYYVAMPVLAFGILGAAVSAVFMTIDEAKYLPILIAYFGILVLAIIGLLIASPIIRKREIMLEISKLDFEIDCIDDRNEFEFISDENFRITLSSHGIKVDGHV